MVLRRGRGARSRMAGGSLSIASYAAAAARSVMVGRPPVNARCLRTVPLSRGVRRRMRMTLGQDHLTWPAGPFGHDVVAGADVDAAQERMLSLRQGPHHPVVQTFL